MAKWIMIMAVPMLLGPAASASSARPAGAGHEMEIRIPVHGLDLRTDEGRRELAARAQQVARTVCSPDVELPGSSGGMLLDDAVRACRAQLLSAVERAAAREHMARLP